ncbi:MAG TPA: hypothetical protein VMM78_00330 [Thermomicrobiales bacterium]|nr:hypothetical protein [Thermomicrobiales bacterium]
MTTASLYRLGGLAVLVGAVVGAVTTALELLVSPYNPHGTALSFNMPVHVAKYVGLVVLLLGLTAVYLRQHQQVGRLGLLGFLGVFFGLAFAAMPYNVIEFTMDPSLARQDASDYLDRTYDATPAFSILTSIGFLLILAGIVLFAIVTLRARILPRWTGWLSLASIPIGIILMVLGEMLYTGVVPHPPAWLLLGFTGYGYTLLNAQADLGSTAVSVGTSDPPREPFNQPRASTS